MSNLSINSYNSRTAICKTLEITINDQYIPLDDLITFEYSYDLFKFGINGCLAINDTYSLSNAKNVKFEGLNKISVFIIDNTGKIQQRNFIALDDPKSISLERKKCLIFSFIDEITYTLMFNTAYSIKNRTFENTDRVTMFKSVCSELGIFKLMNDVHLNTDFISSKEKIQKRSIPANEKLLEYFLNELPLSNIRIWFDNDSFHCKELDISKLTIGYKDMKNSKGQKVPVLFTNENVNYDSIFHIHEYRQLTRNKSDLYQAQDTARYGVSTPDTVTFNVNDYINSLILNNNTNFSNLQPSATIANTHQAETAGAQKYKIFESYIQANQLRIGTFGTFKYLNIGTIVNVKLKSTSQYTEHQLMGDVTSSGVYLVTRIINKFIGDKYYCITTLSRFDNPKSIKI